MTREEAIQLLCVEKSIIIEVDENKGAEKMLQAYDMAIEALQTDAVSREAYDAMAKHAKALENLSIEDRVRIMYDANEDIHNIRIIDEVVRCKDCVWSKKWNDNQIFCDRILMRLRETDFCSYGERREE